MGRLRDFIRGFSDGLAGRPDERDYRQALTRLVEGHDALRAQVEIHSAEQAGKATPDSVLSDADTSAALMRMEEAWAAARRLLGRS